MIGYVKDGHGGIVPQSRWSIKHIADRFPYGNVYARKDVRRVPGNIAVLEERTAENKDSDNCNDNNKNDAKEETTDGTTTKGGRVIVCAFAQLGPGKPGTYQNTDFRLGPDTYELRHAWFRACLDKLAACVRAHGSVAFPYKIGCGLAGGNWEADYLPMLRRWSEEARPDLLVRIYRRR